LNRGLLKLVPLTIDLMGFRDVALVLNHKANRCGSRGICRWLGLIS
jgi:hypothetical protein